MPLRAYKITQFDKSLEDIAARFKIADARILLEANQDQFPTGSEDVTTIPPRLVGQTIQVSLPDEYAAIWDWGTFIAKGGESLSAVCARMNKDPRIDPRRRGKGLSTPPWLTPDYLLNLFENASVRGAHGPDASSIALSPHESVAIPFPRVATRSRVIRTSPDLPTTFELDPMWLIELISIYESIRLRARPFEDQIAALREVQRSGLGEVARLLGMQRVLTVLKGHPAKPRQLLGSEMSQLGAVQSALGDLREAAMDKLYTHILEAERRSALDSTLAMGRSIIETIRSNDFFVLAKKLRENAARYPRRVNELCAALSYAIQVLADSPLGEDIAKDVEAAVKFVAGSKPVNAKALASVDRDLAQAVQSIVPAPEPPSALGVMASLVRNVGGAVTSSVGNLPGPSTLAVALFRVQALRAASRVVAAGGTVTTIEVNLEFSTLVAFARNGFAENDAMGEEIMIGVSNLRASISVNTATTAAADQAKILARYDRVVSGRYMASPAWIGGMTIAGLLVLGFSIADMVKTGANRTDAMAAIGGGFTSALGAAKVFNLLEAGALDTFGRIVAVVGVPLSGYQWLVDAKEGNDTTGDALATVGSALLLASLLPQPFAPVLAVVGGALVVGSFVYSLVEDEVILNVFRTKAKIWFLGQTRTFRCGPHYKAQASSLDAPAKRLEDAVLNADFFDADASQRSLLSRLVSSSTEVDMLLGQ